MSLRNHELGFLAIRKKISTYMTNLTKYTDGQINATKEFCQVTHVVHKHELHELTMPRTLSKASGLFEFIDFCLSGMLANIYTNTVHARYLGSEKPLDRFYHYLDIGVLLLR